jgi:hypothetical protein
MVADHQGGGHQGGVSHTRAKSAILMLATRRLSNRRLRVIKSHQLFQLLRRDLVR